jgi:hypothetical protein
VSCTFKLDRSGFFQRRTGYDYVQLRGPRTRGAFENTNINFVIGLGDRRDLFNKLDDLFPEGTTQGSLPVQIEINGASFSGTLNLNAKNRNRYTN